MNTTHSFVIFKTPCIQNIQATAALGIHFLRNIHDTTHKIILTIQSDLCHSNVRFQVPKRILFQMNKY